MMNMVSWNCRGMGSSLKINAIRDLINQEQPDFLLIQETKTSDQDFQKQVKRIKNFEGYSIGSEGASGGIGTLWNRNKWTYSNLQSCNWWIKTELRNKSSQEIYSIYNIYAPNHYRDKARCWESLSLELQSLNDSKIILGGDLNLIRNVEEKFGGKFYADPSREALEVIIQTHNLIDIPPSNGKYTWSNKRIGSQNIKERLDRFLLQEGIAASFSCIKSKIIQASASDHKPVVINMERGRNMGPLPFKYNKIWDQIEDFHSLVQSHWALEVWGSPYYVWENKLKSLRTAIKQWAKEHAPIEKKKKMDLHTQMEKWNKEKENTQPSNEDLSHEKEMYRELYRQNRVEEEEQRQKSRCLWLRTSGKNTYFFHNNIKIRRAGNQIDKIEADGQELSEKDEIKEAAFNHFKSLLTAGPQQLDSSAFLSVIENKIPDL